VGAALIAALIKKLERYGAISDDERGFLEQAPWRVVTYQDDQPIVREGDAPKESCLVVEGFACRFKSLLEGTRQIMAFHIPGDFCDLHSFLLKMMDHGIAAVGPCTIAKVPHATVEEITERHPRLTRALWWDTAMDAAIHREWMISMGRRSAYQQIAHLLCELLLRLRSVGLAEGNSYELPATQNELGDAFGLSTVHVNRMLQELRTDGLIIYKGKLVTIPDPERLIGGGRVQRDVSRGERRGRRALRPQRCWWCPSGGVLLVVSFWWCPSDVPTRCNPLRCKSLVRGPTAELHDGPLLLSYPEARLSYPEARPLRPG
jgi:CRP-like cAMP-binding protein